MIRYALVCDKAHGFESWFPSSAAFDKQAKRGLVTCPACGSANVEKAVMAPKIGRTGQDVQAPSAEPSATPEPAPVAMVSDAEREIRAKLKELREHLTGNSDYVGAKFPEEARKIHYGETEQRSIYGEASLDDAKALHEEGIEFHPLPVLPDDRN